MNNHFEIIIQEEDTMPTGNVQLPVNFITIGEIAPDDVNVYIRQNVYHALEVFSASDTEKELGSILLGAYCQENGSTHVILSDYIEAKYADASAATLTFTHDTWDYIHSEHDRLHQDKTIIGWQHTHPSYGIFLSGYDTFIQENFFNLPFQIAYVIDPIRNLRGFFQWKNGKIEKLKGYHVFDDIGKPIKTGTQNKKNKIFPRNADRITFPAGMILLWLAVFILLLHSCLLYFKSKPQSNEEHAAHSTVSLADEKNKDIRNRTSLILQLTEALKENE